MGLMDLLRQKMGFSPFPRTYRLDKSLVLSLRSLASRENRSEDEVAAELLTYALDQRKQADVYLRHWNALSSREQQIAALTCLNYPTTQIAERLFLSPETVKSHIRNILLKFGLRRRSELHEVLASWDFSAWDAP